MHQTAQDLHRWEIPNVAHFEDTPSGLVRLAVRTPFSTGEVYMQGAHVTHFHPLDGADALFVSGKSHFERGKAIRGGVPVIFPWFGPRAGSPESPMHGFARTLPWEVESVTATDDGAVTVVLALRPSAATRAHWPQHFVLRHRIVFGKALEMTLEVENTDPAPFTFEEALHTYLAVEDARSVEITGLDGVEYIDKTDSLARKKQEGAIRYTAETDRVYVNTESVCRLDDPAGKRAIEVAKSGSATTVIWNPWIAKAAALADFGDDEWPRMACIETANAGENTVRVAAGATHRMTATVRVL